MFAAERDRDEEQLLTISEAAELLGVSAGTLRKWDRAGKLSAVRHPMNRYRLYRLSELRVLRKRIEGSVE